MSMAHFQVAMLSDPGGRDRNEDACGYWSDNGLLCCVVADGAGGHGGGREASRYAVRHVLSEMREHPRAGQGDLTALLRRVNEGLRDARAPGTDTADMFSTVACLVLDGNAARAEWAHVGDTRIYWFRNGRLATRTRDHSVVQLLADQGHVAAQQVQGHPRRSELLCALGTADEDLQVGQGELARLAPGQDAFLICTDGVWEHFGDEALESSLLQADSPQDWVHGIEKMMAGVAARRPHHDNFSALAVWVMESAQRAPAG